MIGRFTRNTDPYQKCSSSSPDATGPIAAPAPEMPAQMAIAFARSRAGNTLARIDSVDGHDEGGADAHDRARRDEHARRVGEHADQRPEAEDDEAGLQRALAPEAVAERGGREQQPGEHQAVGVDDPLDVGVGRPDAALGGRQLQRRQGDVEHGVADDDDDQRGAQHGQASSSVAAYTSGSMPSRSSAAIATGRLVDSRLSRIRLHLRSWQGFSVCHDSLRYRSHTVREVTGDTCQTTQ